METNDVAAKDQWKSTKPEEVVKLGKMGTTWKHGLLGAFYYMSSTGLQESPRYPQEEPFTATLKEYTDGWHTIKYQEPDGEGIYWQLDYKKNPNNEVEWKFDTVIHGQHLPVGFSIRPSSIDYGKYAPRLICDERQYWDAHSIQAQAKQMAEFLSDPGFNGVLPKDLLPDAALAARELADRWGKEIDAVSDPNSELRALNYQKLEAQANKVKSAMGS
ncbi:MAG: hypothetical protein M1484_01275 [Patescibacteria group bacterium]|nr:hypothetical protein [Patescibacteria group bacterium]MCL5431712.1 hypothetical protein [Patescibacteria group bacterium]